MIFDYGFSLIGKSHISGNIPCQDNHKIKKLENGCYIAAIADGVGSAKNSQTGSKIATEKVVELCEKCIPSDCNIPSIKCMMRTAYNYAFNEILKEAKNTGNPIESYDTTLSVVLYDGHKIVYAHSGDGAIIGLNTFGSYIKITKPQKGEDGNTVIPLRSGYSNWEIDVYNEELASVLLVTDGMLEVLCNYLLNDSEQKVYTAIASFFADPIGISQENNQLKKSIEKFVQAEDNYKIDDFYSRLSKIYKKRIPDSWENIITSIKNNNNPIKFMNRVQDDKTIVGLINTDIIVDNKEQCFYKEPKWDELEEKWNQKAYPHLYQNQKIEDTIDKTRNEQDYNNDNTIDSKKNS